MDNYQHAKNARIWSQSVARRALMGPERTNNPTPAAAAMLGKRVVKRAKAKLKRGGRRRAHKGNPLPAIAAILGSGVLKGLGGRFRKPSEVRAAALAPALVAAANQGNLTAAAGLIERAAKPMIAKEHAVWAAAAAQLSPEIIATVHKNANRIPKADQSNPEAFAQSVMANAVQAAGSSSTGDGQPVESAGAVGQLLDVLGKPGTIRTIASAARPRRSRRQRYPTYQDQYGRQRYSYKPPGSQLRIPRGAIPSAGTPYSFFRGAVGSGGVGTTVAQGAVAAAAGVAAYLVTQRLLQYLGGRAQAKEEAGVNAALAFRKARADFKQQQGRDPNRAELQEMKRAYQAQLVQLGYDPVTFTRKRSGVENFLEDYNPLGGDEE